MKQLSIYLLPLAVFCGVLGMIASTINEKTQRDFNLQHIGVEGLVERHTFALEGSKVPELLPLGDTFHFSGHTYAIKQPGQFVIGAAAYTVLHAFGQTYLRSYVDTAAQVTFYTSGVLTALLAVALYYVTVRLMKSQLYSVLVALASTLGTLMLPYAGVAHHDVQATALLGIGWSLVVLTPSKKWSWIRLLIAGFLIGFSLFVSMLPIVICICIGLFIVLTRALREVLVCIVGMSIGVIPVFLFNLFVFGSVTAFPNTISGTTDTTPFFSVTNISQKLEFYLLSPVHSLFLFMPFLVLACIGLLFFERKYRSYALFIFSAFALHLLYISSIETVGHAQYGPRYLLPIMPFLSLGLVGLYRVRGKLPYLLRLVLDGLLALSTAASIVICTVGALGGVMYQTIWIHPFPGYWNQVVTNTISKRPLSMIGVSFLLTALILGLIYLIRESKLKKP